MIHCVVLMAPLLAYRTVFWLGLAFCTSFARFLLSPQDRNVSSTGSFTDLPMHSSFGPCIGIYSFDGVAVGKGLEETPLFGLA